jgi:hypothetical protein
MTPTRYLTFWEFPIEDTDRAIMKWNKFIEATKKTPLKYPKLTNYHLFVSPEFKLRFVPVLEATKTFETYNKIKEEMKVELR